MRQESDAEERVDFGEVAPSEEDSHFGKEISIVLPESIVEAYVTEIIMSRVEPHVLVNPDAKLIEAAVKVLAVGVNSSPELVKVSSVAPDVLFTSLPPYPLTGSVLEGLIIPGIVMVTKEKVGPERTNVTVFAELLPTQLVTV